MAVSRYYVWVCDECGARAYAPGLGLPKGWRHQRKSVWMRFILHACKECLDEMDEAVRGNYLPGGQDA